jgi:hypothetical protein
VEALADQRRTEKGLEQRLEELKALKKQRHGELKALKKEFQDK